jgi:hypothetical protein
MFAVVRTLRFWGCLPGRPFSRFGDQAVDEHLRAICALDLIRSAYDLPMFDLYRHRKRLNRIRFRAEHFR